jgi:hypothetical protein
LIGTIDDQYLTWLYAHVAKVQERQKHRSYWLLLGHLYRKEFTWLIPGDRNRAEDGRELRRRFADSQGLDIAGDIWLDLGASVLEVLFDLSYRLSFNLDRTPEYWFWVLIDNLGLKDQTDAKYDEEEVEDVLDQLLWREYSANGVGGLFPLRYAEEDQRHLEIWYQLNAYVLERF